MPDDTASRFWAKVDRTDECWLWTGYLKPNGYASFYPGGGRGAEKVYAHRYSFEAHHGPIPQGHEVDHTCNVRHCVNPAHLEAVTHRANLDRAVERRTECRYGHTLADAYMSGGNRQCRTCTLEHARRYRSRKRMSIVRCV